MSDQHLLLPGAHTPVVLSPRQPKTHWLRWVMIALGLVAILIGAADMVTRLSVGAFGSCGAQVAFGPAIGALDPSATQSANGAAPCK